MLRMNQLIGFGGRRSVEVLDTLSFIATTSSNNLATIDLPASGIEAGDLLMLFQIAVTVPAANITAVTPTGWTNLADSGRLDASSAAHRLMVDYKIATGSEDGTTITGMAGSATDRKIVAQFRGNTAIAAISIHDLETEVTANNPSAKTNNAGSGVVPLIAFGNYFANVAVDPRTFSPAEDGELAVTGSSIFYVKYKIYNSSPSNHTIDMDDEGTNVLSSFYIQCT